MTDTAAFVPGDLSEVLTPAREGDDFVLRVPPGWAQGRGAYGGLVMGALARAVVASEPEADRELRSIAGEIAGPVLVGDARIAVRVLRRGSGVSTCTATLSQGDEALAHASVVLGKTRLRDREWTPEPPRPTPWDAVVPMPRGFAPEFTQQFDMRITGSLPFSGGIEPVTEGWVRTARPLARLDAPEIVALADVWYPAGFSIEQAPRPVATIAYTAQVFAPPPSHDPAAPLFHRARAVAAHDGFQVELRELWTAEGALVALNQQTFVWIK